MPRGLKQHYKAAITKSATSKRPTSACQKSHHETIMVREGLLLKGATSKRQERRCQALKNKPSRGGGEGGREKREVKKEICPDLLSSFSDTPTSTR